MKKLLIALAICLCVSGCATPVGKQILIERQSFNLVLDAIHAAHVGGVLPTSQEAKTVPYIVIVRAALDAADAAFIAGDANAASVYLKAAAAGIQNLTAFIPKK